MKRMITLIFSLALIMPLYSGAETYPVEVTDVEQPVVTEVPVKEIFTAVEEEAKFPGGEDAMQEWIKSNLCYPKQAKKARVEGIVKVDVTIEKDGSISDARVKTPVNELLDTEALRLVSSMPNWKPQKNNGVPVRAFVTIPIKFSLNKK